ncbi:MAG: glycosyltransferase [Cyanobacteria bacterium J06623_4]
MLVAYLINQYPKVSHSFIRREIAGLEANGLDIVRYSIRSCVEGLVDDADKREQEKTRVLLDEVSLLGLVGHLVITFLQRPIAWMRCVALLLRLSWWSQKSFVYHMAYLAEACVILRWSAQAGISHIHTHFGTNATEVAMLCHMLGGPSYSFTVHGPTEFDKPLMLSLGEKIERATFVIAVSSFGKSQLSRWCSYRHWGKIHVVHCGVDAGFLQAETMPMSPVPTLVCVGRLVEQKGQLLLIEAASRLVEAGREFRLLLVGDGELRPQIEQLIDELNLTTYVTITGWASSEEVRQFMLLSRALVLPSFAEGLPVVLMESLALQRPVISTYIAGIPELVESGTSGWLIPSGSVTALAEAMAEALSLPRQELEIMGAVGAKRVAEQFDSSTEAKKLSFLFRQQAGELWLDSETTQPQVQTANAR